MTNINREIAECMMGWYLKETTDEYGNKFGEWFNSLECEEYTGYDAYYIHSDGKDVTQDLSFLWSPSTNIPQAFEVVKKLLLDGAEIIIRPHIKSTFVEIFYNGRWYEDYADTTETAICKAVLRAVGSHK